MLYYKMLKNILLYYDVDMKKVAHAFGHIMYGYTLLVPVSSQ